MWIRELIRWARCDRSSLCGVSSGMLQARGIYGRASFDMADKVVRRENVK